MKVYSAHAKAPDMRGFMKGGYDYEGHLKAEKEYASAVVKEAKAYGAHPLAGAIVRVPFADGAAEYVVAKIAGSVSLICLEVGDKWRDSRFERLATVAELKRMTAQRVRK